MNLRRIVKLSNRVGIVATVLLVYWVFAFIVMEVFGLKVFRENITNSFYFSVLGILALMFGALILNVMINLTIIAERREEGPAGQGRKRPIALAAALLAFLAIAALLFGGDRLSSLRQHGNLVAAANSIAKNRQSLVQGFANYEFSAEWISDTAKSLRLLSKLDESFDSVSLLVEDDIGGEGVFLEFGPYGSAAEGKGPLEKLDFVYGTNEKERDYLSRVFAGREDKELYSSKDGHYKMLFPVAWQGRRLVLLFVDRQRYGYSGS